jgi:hypothetical protein
MSGSPTYRRMTGAFCVVVAFFFLTQKTRAGRAYLQVVGAPGLRFQPAMTNYFVFDPKMFSPVIAPAETVSNAVNELATARVPATNSTAISVPVPEAVTNVNPVATAPEIAAEPKKDYLRPFNFSFSSASASDLLTVTPQMITQYLKPDVNETNQLDHPGAVVFVPAEMQFAPPPTKITAESRGIEGNESRATYQSP